VSKPARDGCARNGPGPAGQGEGLGARAPRPMVVDLVIKTAWTAAWLLLGWAKELEQALSRLTTNSWLLVPLFAAIFFLSFEIFDIPLGFYSNYILAHRYGQSTQSVGGWVKDDILG